MLSTQNSLLPAAEVEKLVARWQTCLHRDVPGLFLAFDSVNVQTERVVTFTLDNASTSEVIKIAKALVVKNKNPRFLIHLGLKEGYLSENKIGDPHFTLFLQIRDDNTPIYDNCFELKWEANPSFPTNAYQSPLSGKDAIPGAGAFLFVHRWLETPFRDLAMVFEATAYNLGRRIKGFRYANEDTLPILAEMERENANQTGLVCIHLGSGITVNSHPYAFRPIMQITQKLTTASGLLIGDGGSFYDFAGPIPPH